MKITASGRFHFAEQSSPWCGGIGLHLLRGLGGVCGLSVNFFLDSLFLAVYFLPRCLCGAGNEWGFHDALLYLGLDTYLAYHISETPEKDRRKVGVRYSKRHREREQEDKSHSSHHGVQNSLHLNKSRFPGHDHENCLMDIIIYLLTPTQISAVRLSEIYPPAFSF